MAVKGAIRSNGTVRNDGFFGGVNRIGVTGRKVGTQEGRIGCISNKRPKLLIRPLIFVLYAVKEVEWGGGGFVASHAFWDIERIRLLAKEELFFFAGSCRSNCKPICQCWKW